MDGQKLRIIKASAGSGKTYTLAEEYIKMLLRDDNGKEASPDTYKHILAVTFTNKATEEMKSRIIRKLYVKSKKDNDEGSRCKEILATILHDYSSFSVSTIDRFFQGVMRAFAREIGALASYKVELDSEAVLSQAVDMTLSSLEDSQKEDLFEWLKKYSLSEIENGNSWDITSGLKDMAKLFLSEDFRIKLRDAGIPFGDHDSITSLIDEIVPEMNGYIRDVKETGRKAVEIIENQGLSLSDLLYGTSGTFNRFYQMKEGRLEELTDRFFQLEDDLSKWIKKDSNTATKEKVSKAYHAGLNDLVKKAIDLLPPNSKRYKAYQTAKNLREELYVSGIFSDLFDNMRNYLNENNTILLGETTEKLREIINGEDTPFIYERTGTRYDHYMLDEFQDTSRLQWEDFKPLLKESLASGHSNLIVGDIKQSIYRWRGGDLMLLQKEVQDSFAEYSHPDPKNGNWRSAKNIIDFNNGFYYQIGNLLSGYDESIASQIASFYQDCKQDMMDEKNRKGHLKVTFLPKKGNSNEWKDVSLDMMEDALSELRQRYDLSDITILVRTNKEGADVASRLISLNYEVVTEDSLRLAASPVLQKIVALLRREMNPNDQVNNQTLSFFFGDSIPEIDFSSNEQAIETSLYGLCESVVSTLNKGLSKSETPYVTAFMDEVLSYSERFGSDLAGFLDWWDTTGYKKSISAPAGSNAIRVMTIHKAKGLMAGAVIIPFFEFNLKPSGNRDQYMWCSTDSEPFCKAGLLPIRVKDYLKDTVFDTEYRTERLYEAVDAVNTAYVATTRASGDMIIMAPKPNDSKKDYKPDSVSDLLYAHLKKSLVNDVYESGVSDEDRHLAYVAKLKKKEGDEEEKPKEIYKMNPYSTIPLGDRLTLSLRGGDYYDREAGIVRHDILARVDTSSDIAGAVASAVNSEELPASQRDAMVAEMEGYIASVAARHWFDGTYRPMNEVSIVDGNGEVLRPDRVLVEKGKPVGEGKAIVIDYKFGHEHSKYSAQVGRYMELLRDIGYSDVSGYIWYCKLNKVEECG